MDLMDQVLQRLRTRCALAAMLAIGVVPLAGQAYRAPRTSDGKPDLNGIWQALNEANYDLEGHMARPAMALRPAALRSGAVRRGAGARRCWRSAAGRGCGGKAGRSRISAGDQDAESGRLVKPGSGDQML